MVKYFVLEDNPKRIQVFRDKLNDPGDSVTICTNVKDAKEALASENFDILFLDHDLDGRVYVDPMEPNTGYRLAQFIHERRIRWKKLIIHTQNENVIGMMLELLPGAEWIPYSALFKDAQE